MTELHGLLSVGSACPHVELMVPSLEQCSGTSCWTFALAVHSRLTFAKTGTPREDVRVEVGAHMQASGRIWGGRQKMERDPSVLRLGLGIAWACESGKCPPAPIVTPGGGLVQQREAACE